MLILASNTVYGETSNHNAIQLPAQQCGIPDINSRILNLIDMVLSDKVQEGLVIKIFSLLEVTNFLRIEE